MQLSSELKHRCFFYFYKCNQPLLPITYNKIAIHNVIFTALCETATFNNCSIKITTTIKHTKMLMMFMLFGLVSSCNFVSKNKFVGCINLTTFAYMSTKNYTSVRISTALYNEVNAQRTKTGIPIIAFIEKAVAEKIKRIKSKKKL